MARRNRSAGSGSSEDDVNLTPMLDVVFILLIFFIVTAQFIKEPGVPIERKDVDNAAEVSPLAILIAIDENSDIYVDKKIVEPNAMKVVLQDLRRDNPKGEVIVQADNESDAEMLVTVMEAIAEVDGATRINISTERDT